MAFILPILFDAASALNERGSSIGEVMTKYKAETKMAGPEQRQADLTLLWSMDCEYGSFNNSTKR
jgi:hypothetical protein